MATYLLHKQGEQFFDSNGDPLAGGKFKYERAGTSTLLTTYSDAAGTVPNTQTTNRIILNSAGRLTEPVYIDDSFDAKETLYTSADVVVDPWPFDNIPKAVDLTASLSNFSRPTTEWTVDTAATVNLVAGDMGTGRLASTSSNSITYNLPSASAAGNGRGVVIKKTSAANSVTVDGNGSETIDGLTSFTWTSGRAYEFVSDGANWRIRSAYAIPAPTPQGYLTLTSATPVITGDVSAATTVYYTPDKGNLIPIYDGTSFIPTEFSELSLSLVAEHLASQIYDIFVFNNAGTLRLVTGPAWTTATAGAGARGTGAGTTQLTRINGLFVNTVSMTGRNGSTTYAIGANLATYVGSIFMDGTNGQATCHRTYGQSRKWALWNAHNQRQIILKAGDSTASWTYGTATIRASNGASANKATVFQGLQDGPVALEFDQRLVTSTSDDGSCGIGVNSTTAYSGFIGRFTPGGGSAGNSTVHAFHTAMLALGINDIQCLEKADGSGNMDFTGTESGMLLNARWMG